MGTEKLIRKLCEPWSGLLGAGSLQSPVLSLTYTHVHPWCRRQAPEPDQHPALGEKCFDAGLSHSQTSQKMNQKIWETPVPGGKPVSSSSSLWKQSEPSRPHCLALATLAVVGGEAAALLLRGFVVSIFSRGEGSGRGKGKRRGLMASTSSGSMGAQLPLKQGD